MIKYLLLVRHMNILILLLMIQKLNIFVKPNFAFLLICLLTALFVLWYQNVLVIILRRIWVQFVVRQFLAQL